MFSLKGDLIVQLPLDVVRIAIPLLIYFVVMFFVSFCMGRQHRRRLLQDGDARVHGGQQQLRAGHRRRGRRLRHQLRRRRSRRVIGPLVEVPVLIGLVNVALWLGRRYWGVTRRAGARRGGGRV